jgi:hypothetical protein
MAVKKIVNAAGTAYTLTTSPAAVTFGTTSPETSLNAAANTKRVLRVRAVLELVGAIFANEASVTLQLYKTSGSSGTPSSITGSVTVFKVPANANADSRTLAVIDLPVVVYTISASKPDEIALYASISELPTSGSIKISEAQIVVEDD